LPLLLKDGSTAYVYGPDGLPLEQINGSNILWFHHDKLGSTRLITDNNGATQATYTFDAYGKLTASTGSVANPFRFTGEYQDMESGFNYLRARYYDAATGQFLARDPAYPLTLEAYAYAHDSPLSNRDPSGLCIPVCVIIGFAVVVIVVTNVELWKAGYYNNVHLAKPTDERMSAGKPPNYRQNRQFKDVCNNHGLTTPERRVLQRELEERARIGEHVEGYGGIEEVAQDLELGDFAPTREPMSANRPSQPR
jgi:RHS repeat-associated protein